MTNQTKNEDYGNEIIATVFTLLLLIGFFIGLSIGEPQDNRKTEANTISEQLQKQMKSLDEVVSNLERAKAELICEKADGVFKSDDEFKWSEKTATDVAHSCTTNKRQYYWSGEEFIIWHEKETL